MESKVLFWKAMCQTLTYRKIGIEQVTAYAKRNETSLISVIIFKSIGRKKKKSEVSTSL